MVEPLLHYLIPTLALLSFFPERKRLILAISPLAIVLDVDFILKLHRWALHSVATALALTLLTYAVARRDSEKAGRFAAFAALFLLSSHLLLDMGPPGIPLLWPITDDLYGVKLQFYTNPQTLELNQTLDYTVSSLDSAQVSQKSPYLTNLGIGSALMVGILLMVRCWHFRY
ncbi:MAG: metal-dependent hydrolase [Candidatus Altiarchaeota archaeon]